MLELAGTNATRPQPELPDYLPVSDAESLASQYPEGADADRAAALECFQQWSARRFEIGSSELPLRERYTGGFYALRSDGDLLRTIPEGEGRTAESLVRQARPDPGFIIGGPYPDEVLDVRIYPPDDRGQARLLVLHRTVSGIGVQQFSLLVLEKDSWRLAERIEPADVPVSATSGSAPDPSQAVISLNLDVGNPDDDRRFLDLAPSDRPIAVSITNSGSTSSMVILGGQDLGEIAPGETVRVIPFTIPTSVLDDNNGGFQLTVSFTDAADAQAQTSWTIHPVDDPIWGNFP